MARERIRTNAKPLASKSKEDDIGAIYFHGDGTMPQSLHGHEHSVRRAMSGAFGVALYRSMAFDNFDAFWNWITKRHGGDTGILDDGRWLFGKKVGCHFR